MEKGESEVCEGMEEKYAKVSRRKREYVEAPPRERQTNKKYEI